MRPGLPPIKYVALLGTEVRNETHFVEQNLPPSVRLVNIDDRFLTVRRREDGHVDGLEEWPERRVRLHAEEWLEALGCDDALWDDFAPGAYV